MRLCAWYDALPNVLVSGDGPTYTHNKAVTSVADRGDRLETDDSEQANTHKEAVNPLLG